MNGCNALSKFKLIIFKSIYTECNVATELDNLLLGWIVLEVVWDLLPQLPPIWIISR